MVRTEREKQIYKEPDGQVLAKSGLPSFLEWSVAGVGDGGGGLPVCKSKLSVRTWTLEYVHVGGKATLLCFK